MEDEINCEDPQFISMFESCLRVEFETARNTLLGLKSEINDLKVKVHTQLKTRKELKERVKNSQENVSILTYTLNKQVKHVAEISDTVELTKSNLDSDHKIMMFESERRENILKKYENTWQTYQAKYEDFPLANTRKEAKMKLEKLRVEEMVIQYKINEIKKASRQRERITWLRLRERIVEFARDILNNRALDQKLINLNKGIVDLKEQLTAMDNERAAQLQIQEEEKRARALKMLEMPPPKVNLNHMRKIYGSGLKTNFVDGWKSNFENSFDSMSIDTLMLEEMCLADENPQQSNSQNSNQIRTNKNSSPGNASIDSSKSQEEMEHVDAIDTEPNEELDQRMEDEVQQEGLKEAAVPLSGDKLIVEGNEDQKEEEEEEEVPAKRMKLIVEDDKNVSPTSTSKGTGLERTKSQLVDAFTGPRIARIQEVRYKVSPMTKMVQSQPSPSRAVGTDKGNSSFSKVAAGKGYTVDGFASPGILKIGTDRYKVSPMTKTVQSKPNSSSIHLPYGSPCPEILEIGTDRYKVSSMTKTIQNKLNSSSIHLPYGSPCPEILEIGTDRYKVSPMTKTVQSKLNSSSSQLLNRSPGPGISRREADCYKISPMIKRTQSKPGSHMAAPSSCPTVSKIGASLYNASPRTRTVQSKPNIPSPGISRIGADRCNVSPMTKIEQSNLNPSRSFNYGYSDKDNSSFCATSNRAAEKDSHLADRSPGLGIMRILEDRCNVSPIRKVNSINSNPCSMFTPGNYDYSNISNMSFFANDNLPNLKGDQISLYDGSIRDFCGCSNISTPIENPSMDLIATSTANLPTVNTGQTFSQFNFGSILENQPASSRGNILF
ncbi:uncharacterized protein LOC143147054 isoform X2 [Ptiloglossa arizonensis]|uniref:uncharacterized protein LOC143147054 isoform X2 n=1 Tax=Ptiloglossa arizonensis TaxID=3350558 RepID=UPI003FA0E699